STISQQLAKNLFRTRSDLNDGVLSNTPLLGKVIVKTKEWLMAIKLERNYSKKEILTMYLNTVDFGSNAFGIKVAAKTFFNKAPKALSTEESATLVGLLKAPSMYSPVYNPERSRERRNTVLSQMQKYNYITSEEFDKLKASPLKLTYNVENQNKGLAPYFRAEASKYILKWCKENGFDLYADGLKIYTTIDSRMQEYAEQAVEQHMRYQQNLFWKHWNVNQTTLFTALEKGKPSPFKLAKGREPWADENGEPLKNFIKKQMKRTEHYRRLKAKFDGDTVKIDAELNKKVPMNVFCWDCPNMEKAVIMSPYDSLRYYKHFLQTGMVSIEPSTGHIKAWVGGINYKYFKYDHVKQGARQPGSTFKPFVYVAAID
ncbi:MAG: penicillin-binding protein, partial [Chitinophagaceae bacterium]